MVESKHTTGPWRKQGNIILGAVIGKSVARLFTQHIAGEQSGAAEESANASVIVVAPEMLEALENIIIDTEGEQRFASRRNALIELVDKAKGGGA